MEGHNLQKLVLHELRKRFMKISRSRKNGSFAVSMQGLVFHPGLNVLNSKAMQGWPGLSH